MAVAVAMVRAIGGGDVGGGGGSSGGSDCGTESHRHRLRSGGGAGWSVRAVRPAGRLAVIGHHPQLPLMVQLWSRRPI